MQGFAHRFGALPNPPETVLNSIPTVAQRLDVVYRFAPGGIASAVDTEDYCFDAGLAVAMERSSESNGIAACVSPLGRRGGGPPVRFAA